MTTEEFKKAWGKLTGCFPRWQTTKELEAQYLRSFSKYGYDSVDQGIDSYFSSRARTIAPNLKELLETISAVAHVRSSNNISKDDQERYNKATHLERIRMRISAHRSRLTKNRFESNAERKKTETLLVIEEQSLERIKKNNPRWCELQQEIADLQMTERSA